MRVNSDVFNSKDTVPTVKHGCGSIMLWSQWNWCTVQGGSNNEEGGRQLQNYFKEPKIIRIKSGQNGVQQNNNLTHT